MAALPLPYTSRGGSLDEVGLPRPLRTVTSTTVPGRSRSTSRASRRLLPGVAALAALLGLWFGAAALAAARSSSGAGVSGGATLRAGASYVAVPGDSYWSIAMRLDPSGDPRPLVADLEAEMHGAVLQPGDSLVLP